MVSLKVYGKDPVLHLPEHGVGKLLLRQDAGHVLQRQALSLRHLNHAGTHGQQSVVVLRGSHTDQLTAESELVLA